MTNGKKKTSIKRKPSKKTAALRLTRTPVGTPQVDSSSHAETIIGLTDPFSEFASDTRYPDQGSGKTLVTQQRYLINVSSGVSGSQVFAFNPKPSNSGISASGIAGTTITFPAFYNQGDFTGDLLNTYGLSYRVTSFGVRICNVLSATNCAGYLVLAKGGVVPLGSSTTFNPVNFASFDIHSLEQGGEWHMTSHPRSAQAYDPDLVATGIVNTYSDDSWETCYVYLAGAPASVQCLVIEVVLNFEYSAKEDAPIASIARQAPPMDVTIQTAVNHVQNSLEGSHKASTSQLSAKIKRETKKALVKHVIPFLAKKASMALM